MAESPAHSVELLLCLLSLQQLPPYCVLIGLRDHPTHASLYKGPNPLLGAPFPQDLIISLRPHLHIYHTES